MIKVLFFAQLKERLNTGEVHLDLDRALTVDQSRNTLSSEDELWKECLEDGRVLVAVNQTMANNQTRVNPGDEVAFIPPVTGG